MLTGQKLLFFVSLSVYSGWTDLAHNKQEVGRDRIQQKKEVRKRCLSNADNRFLYLCWGTYRRWVGQCVFQAEAVKEKCWDRTVYRVVFDMKIKMRYIFVMNIPSLPSREQERAAAGVRLLMLETRVHCRVHQLDDVPATWPS